MTYRQVYYQNINTPISKKTPNLYGQKLDIALIDNILFICNIITLLLRSLAFSLFHIYWNPAEKSLICVFCAAKKGRSS